MCKHSLFQIENIAVTFIHAVFSRNCYHLDKGYAYISLNIATMFKRTHYHELGTCQVDKHMSLNIGA